MVRETGPPGRGSVGAMAWAIARALVAVGVCGALSYGSYQARRAFILAVVTRDGPAARELALEPSSGGLPRAERVRVALLDGLGAGPAADLPRLSEVCAAGRELEVDVGFPTVSLTVQAALWSGLTQQQTGLFYRSKRLEAPPPGAIPAQVPGSVAVAESHPEIVRSFGFSRALPPEGPAEQDPEAAKADAEAWRAVFPAAAEEAVASAAALVHVHVLRIDEAGHASGGASPEYAEAVAWADALVGRLRAAAPDALWLVLADHGHTPGGGHGDMAPEIRLVRACLAGPGIEAGGGVGRVHMIDLARALADATGARLAPEARGRALPAALADPAPGATLPRTGPGRVVAACVALALALAGGVLGSRSQGTGLRGRLPWAAPAGLVGVAVLVGWPSLSDQAMFAPKGLSLWLGCLPGALIAAWCVGTAAARGGSWSRAAAGQVVPALGCLAAALVLCRAEGLWLLPALGVGEPGSPLAPRWTAAASVAFVLVRSLLDGAAAGLLLGTLWGRLRGRA